MTIISQFHVSLRIQDQAPPAEHRLRLLTIRAHSLDDAERRVMAALNLIDQAKEEAQDAPHAHD